MSAVTAREERTAPPPRILVVDDEPGIQRSVERILARQYQITTASSGTEALEVLAHEAHDLAIVDVRMPGMNGFEVLKLIKSRHPDTEVIIMTGSPTNPEEKLIEALRERAFYFINKPFEKAVLEALVERCLERQSLERQNRSHLETLREDLERARAFQHLLLPHSFPVVPGLRGDTCWEPSDRIGGDFYDFFPLDAHTMGIVIADVAGHGVQAAMYTGMLKSELRSVYEDWSNPARLFRVISDRMMLMLRNQFITAILAVFDTAAGTVTYVNAGHPRFFSRDGIWESTGTPLGLLAGWRYDTGSLPLVPGDRFLFYTDGLTEARRGDGEDFGERRLHEAFMATHALSLDAAVVRVVETAKQFTELPRFEDDVTAILVEFAP